MTPRYYLQLQLFGVKTTRILTGIALLACLGVAAGIYFHLNPPVQASVGTVRPDGDIAGGTQFTTCTTNGNGSCRFGVLDETSEITGDYISTGLNNTSGGEQEEFSMTSVAGSFGDISQVVVKFQSLSVGGCQGGTCDDLQVKIKLDGAYTAAQTVTMDGTDTLRSATFTGGWSGDDDLQVQFVRVVQGGGSPSSKDDDVRIYQVYAEVTYSAYVAATPSSMSQYALSNGVASLLDRTASTTSGTNSTAPISLDFNISSPDRSETLTPKVEVQNINTAFTNTETHTGNAYLYDADTPMDTRGTCAIYDDLNQQMVVWGGFTGNNTKANTNDTWALSLKANQRSQWKLLNTTGTRPQANRAHVCIYDQLNDRMIVFGGWNGSTYLTSAWALTLPAAGTPTWSQLTVAGSPPNSGQSLQGVAVYDPTPSRMITYGGYSGTDNDVDAVYQLTLPAAGTPTWSNLGLTTGASASGAGRDGASAVYDAENDRMIVYGGHPNAFTNEVWSLNLVAGSEAWTQISPIGDAGIRSGHFAAWQSNYNANGDDRMIVFAGCDCTNYFNDVWQLSFPSGGGTPTWTNETPTSGDQEPMTRGFGGVGGIYDPLSRRALFFAGWNGTTYSQDVIAFDLPETGPFEYKVIADVKYLRGRDAAIMNYDPVNQEMVMFGGSSRGDGPTYPYHMPDTWKLNVSGTPYWRDAGASVAPLNRELPSVVYDSGNDRIVNCLGMAILKTVNDCWWLSTPSTGRATWTNLNAAGTYPLARWGAATIYDDLNDRMVVFGGRNETTTSYTNLDFLSLPTNGSTPTWSQPSTSGTGPSARWGSAVIYDPGRDRMVLFGGVNEGAGGGYYGDVYELTLPSGGTPTWSALSPSGTGPSNRRGAVAVYDPDRGDGVGRMVIFGGYNGSTHYNDLWELTLPASGAGAWTQLSPSGGSIPAARRSAAGAYDSLNDRLIIFGGRDANNFLEDTYAVTLDASPVWTNLNPKKTIPLSVIVSNLSSNTSYHWQAWATGSNSGDSSKDSYGSNRDTVPAAIDFRVGQVYPALQNRLRQGKSLINGSRTPLSY